MTYATSGRVDVMRLTACVQTQSTCNIEQSDCYICEQNSYSLRITIRLISQRVRTINLLHKRKGLCSCMWGFHVAVLLAFRVPAARRQQSLHTSPEQKHYTYLWTRRTCRLLPSKRTRAKRRYLFLGFNWHSFVTFQGAKPLIGRNFMCRSNSRKYRFTRFVKLRLDQGLTRSQVVKSMHCCCVAGNTGPFRLVAK